MQLDSIKKIVTAEQEAENIKKNAVTESELLIKQADKITEKNYHQMLEELEKEKQKMSNEVTLQNKQQVEEIRKNAQDECNNISKKADQRLQEAVETIWRRMVLENGNC